MPVYDCQKVLDRYILEKRTVVLSSLACHAAVGEGHSESASESSHKRYLS